MKPFCIYTIFGLGIIVGQTTILGLPVFHGISYDVLIPFVIFLGLDFPERQAGILILMIGFVMDVVSGGIFGLYMTVYLWTFFLIKGAVSYFDVKDLAFRSMVIAVCILAENLVFVLFVVTPSKGIKLLSSHIELVMARVVFGLITGPVILFGLEKIHSRVQTLQKQRQNVATQ